MRENVVGVNQSANILEILNQRLGTKLPDGATSKWGSSPNYTSSGEWVMGIIMTLMGMLVSIYLFVSFLPTFKKCNGQEISQCMSEGAEGNLEVGGDVQPILSSLAGIREVLMLTLLIFNAL